MSAAVWRPRRNWGARIVESTLDGLAAVTLENERLRITVLAGKGADVVEFNDKRHDLDLVWWSPLGLRDPASVAGGAADDAALFHDAYQGGWQDVFPSGGAPSRYRGAALGQHGEVSGLAWRYRIMRDTEEQVAVEFTVHARRLPYRLRRVFTLRRGAAVLEVTEEATNTAPVAVHAMWGQHLAYGRPFLRPGARITLPDGIRVLPHPVPVNPPRRRTTGEGEWDWPRIPAAGTGMVDLSEVPEPGEPTEMAYLTGFRDGWYELTNRDGTGVRVEWDAAVLPYLWLWQESGDTVGYPWWGRAYVLGLEPFSSHPTNGLAEAVDNGSALEFAPGAARTLRWSVRLAGEGGDG